MSAEEGATPHRWHCWQADQYGRNARFVADLAADLIDVLDAKPGQRVLDVGCGAGDLTAALAGHYPRSEVIGIDASPSQIEQARRHESPRLRFEVRRVQDLGWERRFAAVVSIACLHWIPIPEHPVVLERIFHALRPGGRLAVISFHSLEDRVAKRFLRAESREVPGPRGLPSARRPRMRLVAGRVRPSAEEVAANPRARSAVLRVAERLAG